MTAVMLGTLHGRETDECGGRDGKVRTWKPPQLDLSFLALEKQCGVDTRHPWVHSLSPTSWLPVRTRHSFLLHILESHKTGSSCSLS